jgi:hypothetical protein
VIWLVFCNGCAEQVNQRIGVTRQLVGNGGEGIFSRWSRLQKCRDDAQHHRLRSRFGRCREGLSFHHLDQSEGELSRLMVGRIGIAQLQRMLQGDLSSSIEGQQRFHRSRNRRVIGGQLVEQ